VIHDRDPTLVVVSATADGSVRVAPPASSTRTPPVLAKDEPSGHGELMVRHVVPLAAYCRVRP